MTTQHSPAAVPFRADHVGSLLRPAALSTARRDHTAGRLTDAQLRHAEDTSIRHIVAKQEQVGLPVATDGEHRRGYWHLDFIQAISGINPTGAHVPIPFVDADTGKITVWEEPIHQVTAPLRLDAPIFTEHLAFLQDTVTTATPKLSIPSPNQIISAISPLRTDGVYATVTQARAAVAQVYRDQIAALYAQGLRYLQIDDVSLALHSDPNTRERLAAAGLDPDRVHLDSIALLNDALAGRPKDLKVAVHLCRGNFQSAWAAQGGYEVVADALFNELDVDGYFLEFDTDRAGGFAPLRYLPAGKRVAVGLVTTKNGTLEDHEDVLRRLEDASSYTDIDRLSLAPQCGFSSTEHGNHLSADEQWAKLELVVAVAQDVWGTTR